MITAGVDVGAKYAKAVILKDGQVMARAKALVGFDLLKSAAEVFEVALKDAGLSRSDIQKVVSTGMGRNTVVQKPPISAEEAVSEVVSAAAGAYHVVPTAKTVIDVGAEEGRGIKVESGKVKDFVINERCAAGAGTFIEAMARALEVKVEDMGPLSLKSVNTIPMNAQRHFESNPRRHCWANKLHGAASRRGKRCGSHRRRSLGSGIQTTFGEGT